jgi:hypothetical protein
MFNVTVTEYEHLEILELAQNKQELALCRTMKDQVATGSHLSVAR